MARQRKITLEDFSARGLMGTLTEKGWLLAIGMRLLADDRGVLPLDPKAIRRLLPLCNTIAVGLAINDLEAKGAVKVFDGGDGHRYVALRDFVAVQRPPAPGWRHPLPEALYAFVGLSEGRLAKLKRRGIGSRGVCGDDFGVSEANRKHSRSVGKGVVKSPVASEINALPVNNCVMKSNPRPTRLLPYKSGEKTDMTTPASAPPAAPASVSRETKDPHAVTTRSLPPPGMGPARIQPIMAPRLALTVVAPAAGRYEWEGKLVKLNRADYEKWRAEFAAIPDFKACLRACDDWISSELERRGAGKVNWFLAAKQYMAKRHQEWAARKAERAAAPHPYSVRTLLPRRAAAVQSKA